MAAPIELDTVDKLEYVFHPVANGICQFRVRAPNDAHLAFCTDAAEADPMYEVFIGGWKNSKSVIRKNRTKPDVAEADTPDILNDGEFRGFWVRWDGNTITVGKEGEVAAFLTYEDNEVVPINYVGVCTGWGACGSWIIEAPQNVQPSAPVAAALLSSGVPLSGVPNWVQVNGGAIPPNAVPGGIDGEPLFIGRASHEGAVIPGKVVPSHGVCYIPWGGAENPKEEYEVLCDAIGHWVQCSGADVPGQALQGGSSEDGEPLFIGRASHEGTQTIGKVQQSHGVCYIPYGGQEIAYTDYEVFITQ